jgi:hypothetical protein
VVSATFRWSLPEACPAILLLAAVLGVLDLD